MKTVTLRNRTRALRRLFLFCFVILLGALAVTIVDAAIPCAKGAASEAPASRDFWIRNPHANPQTFRKAHASLRASGDRSVIYVEDKLFNHGLSSDFLNRLSWQLEKAAPSSAYITNQGVVPLEEKLFGSLTAPDKGHDERLIVLFADLGKSGAEGNGARFDGFFNIYDQLSEADAMRRYGQHSNEANLIYINGFRGTESYTTGVISRELEHLLTAQRPPRESWLAESLAEGAMLLTGFYGDQKIGRAHV